MYLSFYHLHHKPFQISTDPRFLWLGEKHEEALATLRYGVLDNKGFLLLTGDVGTGKTTLINALLNTLGNNILAATLRDPDLEPMDFYNYIAHAFGMAGNFTSKGTFLIEFERFLHQANTANKTVLLIIDEAQRINQKLLEEVRLLSNIEKAEQKLLNIFFVGQIEFNDILHRPENRPIRQRITVNYNIQTLTKKETKEYIHYRLKIAGTERKIFEEDALNAIFSFSQGYPRLINIICDRSLLTGYVEEAQTIAVDHVRECIEELTIPQFFTQKTSPQTFVPPAPETVAAHAADDPMSISLIRAHARKHTVSSRKQILAATLIGILVAASFLFLFFSQNINSARENSFGKLVANIRQHISDYKQIRPANTTLQAENPPPSPDNVQINTYPLEILKPDSPLPKKNVIAPEVTRSKEQDTTKMVDKSDSDTQPATKSLPSQGTIRNTYTASADDTPNAEVETIKPISLETYQKMIIPFPSDSSFPAGHMLGALDNLAKALLRRPEFKVIITGYTDSIGHEPYNRKLSEFRANTVKSYLVGKGLTDARIIARGLGSENPIASNETPDSRIANRRVEIELQEQ